MTGADLWDAEALTFDDEADHGLRDPAVRAAWRDLLLGALPAAPARVADLGSGTGTLSLLLAEEGYAVDGVDFSAEMVRLAQAKAGHLATFVIGDAAEPPLVPGGYDVVLCRHVLWALPDRPAALRRWAGLLREGGRMVLVEGHWGTGAGLTAEQTMALVGDLPRMAAELTRLPQSEYWGREVDDDRYLVVARPAG